MPDPTVTFSLGSETITVPGPDYPEHPGSSLAQFTQVAMGGRVTTLTQATAQQFNPILTWTALPDADFLVLEDFFNTVAIGAENEVNYTDYRGASWTAIYLGGLAEAEQDEFGHWVLKLRLKAFEVV